MPLIPSPPAAAIAQSYGVNCLFLHFRCQPTPGVILFVSFLSPFITLRTPTTGELVLRHSCVVRVLIPLAHAQMADENYHGRTLTTPHRHLAGHLAGHLACPCRDFKLLVLGFFYASKNQG